MVRASKPDGIQARHVEAITIAGVHAEARPFGRCAPAESRNSMIGESVHFDDHALSVPHTAQSILDYEGVQIVCKCHDRDRAGMPLGPWCAHSDS